MVEKAEGTFYSAWHGAGLLPLFVGGSVNKFQGDEWNMPQPSDPNADLGSKLLYIGIPVLIGSVGVVKTYEALLSDLKYWNNRGELVFHAPACKVMYRTQPNLDPESIIPEHIFEIDISGTDENGVEFVAMTPRIQGPRAGFGKVDVRLVVGDAETTNRELKLEVRKAIPVSS